MKFVSWNVNWLRAIAKKWFFDYLENEKPEVIWLQEIKVQEHQIEKEILEKIGKLGYQAYFNPAVRPGYSGTAVLSKVKPQDVILWIKTEWLNLNPSEVDEVIEENHEGRVTTLDFWDFYYVTVYTPNSKDDLSRLLYRTMWDKAFLAYMKKLEEKKPVIFCWDLNVAHQPIDLKHPKPNEWKHGYTLEERIWFDNIIKAWFIDTLRYQYPEIPSLYTWWSYMGNARKNNSGWRIDYVLTTWKFWEEYLKESFIRPEILWSDHCPVGITIKN
jgi:exodeoxyribonuclease III